MEVVRLKDGRVENIGRDRDFIDLIREYMGRDCAEYYENHILDLTGHIDETVAEVKAVFDDMLNTKTADELRQYVSDYKDELVSVLKSRETL